LNNRGFALANRGLAFSDTAGKAKSQHQGADHHDEFLHEAPHQLNYTTIIVVREQQLVRKSHSAEHSITFPM
jgi:hypothetical protein